MKKYILLIFIPIFCFSQKYKVSEAKTSFFSYAPLENITAFSEDLQGIIDMNSGEFFFRLPIKSFTFKRSLMQTHFNDKYMNSDKFPHSIFKGQSDSLGNQIEKVLKEINKSSLENEQNIISKQLSEVFNQGIFIEGILSIHGEEKNIKTKVVITLEDERIHFFTMFFVETDDFKIKIPKLLKDNISEKIEVKVSGFLNEFKE
tara:strand:- start:806 stop:1414 length:609 start_codon:yes stop_codon:yes gene_type:complete